MTYTRAQKVGDLATGAAVGGSQSAAVGVAATIGLRSLSKVAPAAAKAVGVGISWPVVGAAMGVGAAIGAAKAHAEGRSMVGGAIAGSLFIFPKHAQAEEAARNKSPQPVERADPGDTRPTNAERQKQLADRPGAGGDPEVFRNIAANSRKQMDRAKTTAERNAQERRALLAEEKYEQLTGKHIGPTRPETPAEKPSNAEPKITTQSTNVQERPYAGKPLLDRMLDATLEAISGKGQTHKDNKYDQQRAELHDAIRKEQDKQATEFKNHPQKGPQQKAFDDRIDQLRGKLKEVDAEEEKATAGDRALMRSAGAVLGGAIIGGWLGSKTVKAAEATTLAASKSIEKVAANAAKVAGGSRATVIQGTIAGDHAAGAIKAAKMAATAPPVSAVQAFGVPALNLLHGGIAVGYATAHPEDPTSTALRTEGMAAISAGVVGTKFGMQARALRPYVSPANQAKLNTADARMNRELRKGPAGVARAKAAQVTGVAQNKAARRVTETAAQVGVARAKGQANVSTAQVRGNAKVQAAKIGASLPVINAGTKVGVAKARGASRVGVAEAKGKRQITSEIKKGQTPVYKDVWATKTGQVKHRIDMSVRKPSVRAQKAAANDNITGIVAKGANSRGGKR